MAVKRFDFNGQVCPLPVINAIKQMKQLDSGDTMEIITDDPLAMKSIPEELSEPGVEITVQKQELDWLIVVHKK